MIVFGTILILDLMGKFKMRVSSSNRYQQGSLAVTLGGFVEVFMIDMPGLITLLT